MVLVDMAVVAPQFRGTGMYQTLRKKAQNNAKALGYAYVAGELSSAATQHVVTQRMGHEKISEVRFDTFEHKAQRPFASVTAPTSLILTLGAL